MKSPMRRDAAADGAVAIGDEVLADQAEHALAADQAQQAADVAIEMGDYAAAAELRETAETAAELAGTDEMLSGADAIDLKRGRRATRGSRATGMARGHNTPSTATTKQLETRPSKPEWTQREADSLAGGSDHSGQAAESSKIRWIGPCGTKRSPTITRPARPITWRMEMRRPPQANSIWRRPTKTWPIGTVTWANMEARWAQDDPFSETANDHGFDGAYDSGFDAGSAGLDSGLDSSYDSGTDLGSNSYTEY